MDALQLACLRASQLPKTNGHTKLAATEQPDQLVKLKHRIEALEIRLSTIDNRISTLTNRIGQLQESKSLPVEPEPTPRRRPHMREIIAAVCKAYNVSDTDLLSERRTYPLAFHRQIAMYLCTRLTFHGLPGIGRIFMRDHTTVLHARDKIALLRNTNEKLRAELVAMEAKLYPQP